MPATASTRETTEVFVGVQVHHLVVGIGWGRLRFWQMLRVSRDYPVQIRRPACSIVRGGHPFPPVPCCS